MISYQARVVEISKDDDFYSSIDKCLEGMSIDESSISKFEDETMVVLIFQFERDFSEFNRKLIEITEYGFGD